VSEWRIDELAQRADVAVDTIRYYQREGLLPPGERSGRSMRFGPRHLERLERIRGLQSRRFSLAAIRELLDHHGGPSSLEALLAGRGRATYDRDQLVAAAGLGAEVVSGLERTGLLREPAESGLDAYDGDDVDMLHSFADLSSLGVPDDVLLELARILSDGIDRVQRQTTAVFHGEEGPAWGAGVREEFESATADQPARVVRDLRAIADYVQHRGIQRALLHELGEPFTDDELDR
jgi:DNA-binding transcriptional MerR regulator